MREKSSRLADGHSSGGHRAPPRGPSIFSLRLSPSCLLPFAFCFLPFLAASAAQQALRVDVLRAEANGSILDVLLRVETPGVTEELRPGDFAVFIAPADLSMAEATKPPFRLPRLFLKRLGNAYYIDLRQLPAGVGAAACQLVLRIARAGQPVATHRLPRLLDAPAEELDVALLIDESLSMRRTDPEKLRVAAAKTFVDLARRSTRIGHIAVVGFNTEARTLAPLTPPLQAETLYEAIERVRAFGQTDMDATGLQLMHDFGRGQEGDLDAVELGHDAAIAALMPGLAQSEAGALEQSAGGLLETSLGRNGNDELRGHHASPFTQASRRSV